MADIISADDLRGYIKNVQAGDEQWIELAASFGSNRVVEDCNDVTADENGAFPAWAQLFALITGQHSLTLMRRFGATGVAGFSVPNAARDAAGIHLKLSGFA